MILQCMFLCLLIVPDILLAEHSGKSNVAYTSELLSATMPLCNNKSELSCPAGDSDRDNRIMFCGFSCPQGTEYICKEDKDHGIIEFCAKPEICDKGQMNRVYFDEEHQRVVIEKTSCPVGFFQPFEKNCYTACTEYRHVDESFLPNLGIKVLYHGNSTNSGIGYCDVDRGYVNMDSNMYINLVQYEVSVCEQLENYKNKCDAGQRLLPDSQCVPVCDKGYEVDREDSFRCSLNSTIDSVISYPASQMPGTSTELKISTSTTITSKTTAAVQEKGGKDYTVIVMVILVVVAVVLGILLAALCIYVKHCKKNKDKGPVQKNKKAYDRCNIITVNGDLHIDSNAGRHAESHVAQGSTGGEDMDETEVLQEV